MNRCNVPHPAWSEWLEECRGRGALHGAKLAEILRGADNVARADRYLRWLEEDGLIVRGAYEPTREQRFFGVGGRAGVGREPRAGEVDNRYPVEFVWMPACYDGESEGAA